MTGMKLRIINEGDNPVEIKYTKEDTAYKLSDGIDSDSEVVEVDEEVLIENVDRVLSIEEIVDDTDDSDDDEDDGSGDPVDEDFED